MKGFLCFCRARNNEEFRKVMSRRKIAYLGVAVLGGLTILGTYLAGYYGWVSGEEYSAGFFGGVGTGLILAGIVLFIRCVYILKDEKRLKEERLKCTDEREQAIGARALKNGTAASFVALYIICMAAALRDPDMVKPLLLIIWVFLLSYIASIRYYQKRM